MNKLVKVFSLLYDKVLALAEHRHAPYYLACLSFSEASFFPIPPDFMLAPMALSKPARAWWYATLTTLCSVLGGLLGYLLGMFFITLIEPSLVQFGYGLVYHKVQHWFLLWGFWALFFTGYTPIPFKVFTLTSGAVGMPIGPFVLASLIGRGSRFYLVSGLMRIGGIRMKNKLRTYINWIGWLGLLVLSCLIACLTLFGCSYHDTYAPVVNAWQDPYAIKSRYRVQKDDTIYSIALAFDMDYRDLAKANCLSAPYTLKPGQTLTMHTTPSFSASTPEPDPQEVITYAANDLHMAKCFEEVKVVPRVTEKTIEVKKPLNNSKKAEEMKAGVAQQREVALPEFQLGFDYEPKRTITKDRETNLIRIPDKTVTINQAKIFDQVKMGRWQWPAKGTIMKEFSLQEGGNKGIDIAGHIGDPIRAVAPGKVVYSGSGLRGYGNLVILKHSDNYLSAYAHNKQLLVKEGDVVKAGAEIAKMGQNDSGKVLLHFEIRRNGKPVDPLLYL